MSVAAHEAGDRSVLSLTFGALTKTATPLLASQAWDVTGEGIKDQVQDILVKLFEDMPDNKHRFLSPYHRRTDDH